MSHLILLKPNDISFPPHDHALVEPDGLLAIGGDLSVERLTFAYQHGIFPWFNESDPIMWWSPAKRCVIPTNSFHVSKSFNKFLKKSLYTVSINKAFSRVIAHCKVIRKDGLGTWINNDMESSYNELHENNKAHSVEVWKNNELVGGLYGVFVNNTFCGESMFSLQQNASKTALYALSNFLVDHQVPLIDCQITNPHLTSLGAIEIPRKEFIDHLTNNKNISNTINWQPRDIYGA